MSRPGSGTALVVRAVVRNPALRRVEVAFLLFAALEYGTWVALLPYAFTATGPASVGVVAMFLMLPAALLAPAAASLGDRYPRQRVLLGAYLGQAVAFALAGIGMLADAPPMAVYVVAAVGAAMLALIRPAQGSLLPQLSRTPEELSAANGLAGSLEGLGLMTGPLIASAVLLVGSPATVLVGGGIAALAAALLVAGISVETGAPAESGPGLHDREPEQEPATAEPERGVLAGLRALTENRGTGLIVALLGLRFLVVGCLDVLFVLIGMQVVGSESAVGGLTALSGLGKIAGGIVAFALVGRPRLAPALVASGLLFGLAIALIGMSGSLALAIPLIVAQGIGSAGMDVAGRTILQRATPNAVLARVLGALEGLGLAAMAAGSLLVPALVPGLGLSGAAIVAGLLVPLGLGLAWAGLRRIDRSVRVPVRELALLRLDPVFAPLAPPQLEAVASRTRWVTVEPGQALIVEGEPGDRYYVLESGRMRITRADAERAVATQRGEGFGEIALLRSVPRTATVTALEPCVVLAIDRADFLEAVTGHEQARRVAEDTASQRSAATPA